MMFCHNCGSELPDGAKFCNYCGTKLPEQGPRHARPEPEEIYSFSDQGANNGSDVTPPMNDRQDAGEVPDATRVYDFAMFEDNGYPQQEPYDDREFIDDSYDNYTEDDGVYGGDAYQDRLDEYFSEENIPEKKNTWLWVVLGIVAAILVIAIGFIAVRSFTQNAGKNNKPTSLPTVATQAATQKPTEKPTEAPAPTLAPVTEAPAPEPTEAPAPEPETQAEDLYEGYY